VRLAGFCEGYFFSLVLSDWAVAAVELSALLIGEKGIE
jgi:hypothetical protein